MDHVYNGSKTGDKEQSALGIYCTMTTFKFERKSLLFEFIPCEEKTWAATETYIEQFLVEVGLEQALRDGRISFVSDHALTGTAVIIRCENLMLQHRLQHSVSLTLFTTEIKARASI